MGALQFVLYLPAVTTPLSIICLRVWEGSPHEGGSLQLVPVSTAGRARGEAVEVIHGRRKDGLPIIKMSRDWNEILRDRVGGVSILKEAGSITGRSSLMERSSVDHTPWTGPDWGQ